MLAAHGSPRYRAIKAAKVRCRVLVALIIREMSVRFGGKFGGYAWAIAEPTIFVVMLAALFSAIGRSPPLGTSFLLFYASGFLPMQYYTTVVTQIGKAIQANKQLLSYPIVAPIDVVLGRLVLQFTTNTIVIVLMILLIVFYADVHLSMRIERLIAPSLCAALIAMGLGMMNIVLFKKSRFYEDVFSLVTRPMFMISGVIFLPEDLPQPYRDYVMMNPIAHVILWFRTGIYSYYRAPDLDKGFLLTATALIFLVGLLVFTLSRSVREGS